MHALSSKVNRLSYLYDQMKFGIFLVRENEDVIFVNKYGSSAINGLFRLSNNRLTFLSAHNQKLWDRLISTRQDRPPNAASSEIAAFTTPDGRTLLARSMPVPDIILDHLSVNDRCKVVFFHDITRDTGNMIAMLQTLGLSRSEAMLAQTLGHTGSLKESAARIGLSYESARSSLKTIFSKMGIRSQNDLTAIVTRLSSVA
ncbi:helix-turn-helix transcriptional regulator [Gluconacetobacter sacchari]